MSRVASSIGVCVLAIIAIAVAAARLGELPELASVESVDRDVLGSREPVITTDSAVGLPVVPAWEAKVLGGKVAEPLHDSDSESEPPASRAGFIVGRVVDSQAAPVPGAEILVVRRRVTKWASSREFADRWGELNYKKDDDTIHDEILQVRGEGQSLVARSDAAGVFRVEGLDDGEFRLLIVADGFEPTAQSGWSPRSGNLMIVLQREALLLMNINHVETGAPVEHARLTALRVQAHANLMDREPDWKAFDLRFGAEVAPLKVLAGAAAEARLPGTAFPPGRFLVCGAGPLGTRVIARATGLAFTELLAPGVVPADVLAVELRMPTEAVLAGRVLDTRGRPVPGAVVTGAHAWGIGRATPQTAVCDSDGTWELRELPAGAWWLRAEAADYIDSTNARVELLTSEVRKEIQLVLTRSATISGYVRSRYGEPRSGEKVWLYIAAYDESESSRIDQDSIDVETDVDGHYAFRDLLPGTYRVKLRRAGPFDVDLAEGAKERVDFVLPEAAQLSGTVRWAGVPVEHARIDVVSWKVPGEATARLGYGNTSSDEAGRYVLSLPGGGEYRLSVSGYRIAVTQVRMTIVDGETAVLDIDLPSGALSGRVFHDCDSAPLPAALLLLIRDDGSVGGNSRSAEDGVYAFEHVPPGSYRIVLLGFTVPRGLVWPRRQVGTQVQLNHAQRIADLDFRSCPGPNLGGAVVSQAGEVVDDDTPVGIVRMLSGKAQPWEEWTLVVEPSTGERVARATTRQILIVRVFDGRYGVGDLPAGEYRVGVLTDEDEYPIRLMSEGVAVMLGEHAQVELDLTAPW